MSVFMNDHCYQNMINNFLKFMACFSIGTMEKQAINFPRMTLEIS